MREGPTESQSWVFSDIKPFFFISCFSILSPFISVLWSLILSTWLSLRESWSGWGDWAPWPQEAFIIRAAAGNPVTQPPHSSQPGIAHLFLSTAKYASVFFPYRKKQTKMMLQKTFAIIPPSPLVSFFLSVPTALKEWSVPVSVAFISFSSLTHPAHHFMFEENTHQ